MRIIAGSAGGRLLVAPKGMDTRPTQDKIKESLFSILGGETDGARVLDLFAGSGALGLESISRGAEFAVFADKSRLAQEAVAKNIEALRLGAQTELLRCHWKIALKKLEARGDRFDLIFLDPPYADDLLERAVAHIARFDILAPDGIMIAESPAEKELPKLSAPYRVAREYRYGRIKVTLYRRDGEETT